MSDDRSRLGPALAAAEAATTLPELTAALRKLYVSVGKPGYRTLEQRSQKDPETFVSHSTISEYLKENRPRVLTHSFVRRFAQACGAEPAEVKIFELAWVRISDQPAEDGTEDGHLVTLRRMAAIAHTADLAVARDLYQHVHETYERLGVRDEGVTHDLAVTLSRLDDFEGALPLLQRALTAYGEELGADDPLTCQIRDELAIVHLALGEIAEATRLTRENLAIDAQRAPTLEIVAELPGR